MPPAEGLLWTVGPGAKGERGGGRAAGGVDIAPGGLLAASYDRLNSDVRPPPRDGDPCPLLLAPCSLSPAPSPPALSALQLCGPVPNPSCAQVRRGDWHRAGSRWCLRAREDPRARGVRCFKMLGALGASPLRGEGGRRRSHPSMSAPTRAQIMASACR